MLGRLTGIIIMVFVITYTVRRFMEVRSNSDL
jgi:flagellar biogenesis protein FliO